MKQLELVDKESGKQMMTLVHVKRDPPGGCCQMTIDINLTGVYYVSQEFFKVRHTLYMYGMLKQKPATKLRT